MTMKKPRHKTGRAPSRPLPMVGFFALLTPEQKAAALAYTGPENFGSDDWRLPDNPPPVVALDGSGERG